MFLELKNLDPLRCDLISREFTKIFPLTSFYVDAFDEHLGSESRTVSIKIKKIEPSTYNMSIYDLEDSAPNYREVMYLLLEMSSQTDDVLALDELILRLLPRALKHLYRIFEKMNR